MTRRRRQNTAEEEEEEEENIMGQQLQQEDLRHAGAVSTSFRGCLQIQGAPWRRAIGVEVGAVKNASNEHIA